MKKSLARKTVKTSRNKPASITAKLLRSWPLPSPNPDADKDERGQALIIGGRPGLAGAPILSSLACLRAGAGKLTTATPETMVDGVSNILFEALVLDMKAGLSRMDKFDAVLIGPGMEGAETIKLVTKAVHQAKQQILILDAEALKFVRPTTRLPKALWGRVIITPHAGEMAQILNLEKAEVERDAATLAMSFAQRSGMVTVLKGRNTFIASPAGRLYRNQAGNVGLATSGSGDVLAGIICGLAARSGDALQSAVWGVHLHARAGDRLARKIGPLGFLARDLLNEIPGLL